MQELEQRWYQMKQKISLRQVCESVRKRFIERNEGRGRRGVRQNKPVSGLFCEFGFERNT